MLRYLLILISLTQLSYAGIDHSTKEVIEHTLSCELSQKKTPPLLHQKIARFQRNLEESIRVMSFNMLFNRKDSGLSKEYQWENRKSRVLSTIEHWQPDIIGSQELQVAQVRDLETLKKEYAFLGGDGTYLHDKHNVLYENNIIFVRKSRFDILEFEEIRCSSPSKSYLYYAKLKDKRTNKIFYVLNAHLTFRSQSAREAEAHDIYRFVKEHSDDSIIVLGDFNTFPLKLDESFPFYDGDYLESIIKQDNIVVDSRELAILGHFGPLSTSNCNSITKEKFKDLGTPGCFLDHIYVSAETLCLYHTSDPLLIDNFYPSDHLPIIAEIQLP